MRKYDMNVLGLDGFDLLVTLLDRNTPVSKSLHSVELPSFIANTVLIDTKLCSGEHRFIKINRNPNRTFDLDHYETVRVSPRVERIADEVLLSHNVDFKS